MCVCVYVSADVSAGLHGSSTSKFALHTSDVNINMLIPEQESHRQVHAYIHGLGLPNCGEFVIYLL